MADIISIFAAARRLERPVELNKAATGPAQLLFFTGVRYERRDVPEQGKRRKRKDAASVAAETLLNA